MPIPPATHYNCIYSKYFFLLLTDTAQAPRLSIFYLTQVSVWGRSFVVWWRRGDAAHMSLHVRTGQIVTKEERDGDRELRAKQPGESGEGRDPRWSRRSSHDCTAEICEMLNGFVTFTQYFVTKLSTLDSAGKNL